MQNSESDKSNYFLKDMSLQLVSYSTKQVQRHKNYVSSFFKKADSPLKIDLQQGKTKAFEEIKGLLDDF